MMMDWMVKMSSEKTLNEGLQGNDLRGHIKNIVSVDQYKSKLGDDKNVIVLAFKIRDKFPAQDLSQFLESALKLLDVDISPGPDKEKYYSVYVEIERNSNSYATIQRLLDDTSRLDDEIGDWMFTSYENKMPQPWSEEAFNKSVISNAYDYEIKHNPEAAQIAERMKFLNNY